MNRPIFGRATWLALAMATLLLATPALGKTIILDATSWKQVGGMDEVAPNQSLALHRHTASSQVASVLTVRQGSAFLFRFPLDEIPRDHRVVHAELIVPVQTYSGSEPRFYIWRMLTSWGHGVCHLYRQTWPEKLEWTKPGARGLSSDRATRPSDIIRTPAAGPYTINVTEDVEMWAAGVAENHGWMITVEDPEVAVQFGSPLWVSQQEWRLRVTYEPK